MTRDRSVGCALLAVCLAVVSAFTADGLALAEEFKTVEVPQIRGDNPDTIRQWTVDPFFTVGESLDDSIEGGEYTPPGILDGVGAFPPLPEQRHVRLTVNHELNADDGYVYEVPDEETVQLTGSRVSLMEVDPMTRTPCSANLAYKRIFDREGRVVRNPMQINEGNLYPSSRGIEGFDRFCSGYGFPAGKAGFTRNVFLTGEEVTDNFSTIRDPADASGNSFIQDPSRTLFGFGGQECILDVDRRDIYVAPMMGRAAFENVCAVENYDTDKVVLLIGDDRQAAPLYLYIGQKERSPEEGYDPPQFLCRNGLGYGCLYVWVSDLAGYGDRDPSDFSGTGNTRSGKFVKIEHYDSAQAGVGLPGFDKYDSLGFASMALQDSRAENVDCFRFSRPEDLAANPEDATQLVMASTGRSSVFPEDSWGTIYLIDFDDENLESALNEEDVDNIDDLVCDLTIIYDGDDSGGGQFPGPDYGIRSPDNLDWADNGLIYINEDRSVSGFGLTSGVEASIWQLRPTTFQAARIAVMDRNATLPDGQTDGDPTDVGDWESSGILDVTEYFQTAPGETLLVSTVQAHSVRDGSIGGSEELVQGGQLVFVSRFRRDVDYDVFATYDEDTHTLNLVGNDESNVLRIWGQDDEVVIDGFEGTSINGQASVSFPIQRGQSIKVIASMNGGNDRFRTFGLNASKCYGYFGNGNDGLIPIMSMIDEVFAAGGQGGDAYVEVGSTTGSVELVDFEITDPPQPVE